MRLESTTSISGYTGGYWSCWYGKTRCFHQIERSPVSFREKLETLKLYLHSFFYMSLFNSLLVLSMISLVALKLYSLILRQEHLYRDFSVDEEALSRKPLRVMYWNIQN